MYVVSKRDDLILYVQYGATAIDCFDAKQVALLRLTQPNNPSEADESRSF